MTTTVYLVRHGQTYFNCFARLQGWADTPLTTQGEADAVAVGKQLAKLRVDYLFASDLKRAVDTASLLIQQIPAAKITSPTQHKCFREVFYGSFEGHSNEEAAIWASHLGHQRFRRIGDLVNYFGVERSHDMLKEADPAHLAEGAAELNQRVAQCLALFRGLPDQSTVVVVTHGSFIQYLLSRLDGKQTYPSPANGEVTRLRISATTTTIE